MRRSNHVHTHDTFVHQFGMQTWDLVMALFVDEPIPLIYMTDPWDERAFVYLHENHKNHLYKCS